MLVESSKYIKRLIDSTVETHLQAFGAIEIAGTMWSGKTWTSRAHSASMVNFSEAQQRELAQISPNTILAGEKPRLIDEWQEVPSIWDEVRRKVDEAAPQRGLYILTGSSRPSKDSTTHSGSGRISRLRMWPMSLSEMGHSSATISLSKLFAGHFEPTVANTEISELAKWICRGGWPAALSLSNELAGLVPIQYLDTLLSSEDEKAPEDSREQNRFLQALARNIGGAVAIDTLAKDMNYQSGNKITDSGRNRIKNLLAYFLDRFVIDPLYGWDAPVKSPQRVRSKPRYSFADPSLAAAQLGMKPESLVGNLQIFGQLFEQLCLRDLHVYTSVMKDAGPDALKYYRDADGLEVDAVVELRDKSWAGIEIKLGENKVDIAERNLLRLKDKIAANKAARNPAPAFLMILVGVGKYAYQRPSGVYVVPISCLTA